MIKEEELGAALGWGKGIRRLEIQYDAEEIVRLVLNESEINGPLRSVIGECKDWMLKPWTVKVNQVFREQNRAADGLAQSAQRLGTCWMDIKDLPEQIEEIVEEDRPGTRKHRDVAPKGN